MAVIVHTSDPKQLLLDIKKYITDEKIKTWLVDEDGDFTHDVDQWRYQAWLRPFVNSDTLVFSICSSISSELIPFARLNATSSIRLT